MYSRIHGIRYAKYDAGNATRPSAAPNGVNGITVRTAIPVMVSNVTGADARLWINGIHGNNTDILFHDGFPPFRSAHDISSDKQF